MSQGVPLTERIITTEKTESTAARACIHEVFERQARKKPDAVAVSCRDAKLTYCQLNERANQLARYLRKMGVGPEVPVALHLERSLEMVVAILGVLKAGGAYVPIDVAYPKERLAFILEDSQAPVLLTQKNMRAAVPVWGAPAAKVVCLDLEWAEIGAESTANPPGAAQAENAAYVIYTSGSTGKPKGVLVTHHNVVRLFEQTAPWYGFNASDVWPLFHSYAFDVSVWELWGALFHGGRLVVVPYLVTRSPGEFYELVAKEGITVLNQTPSAFRQLIWAEEQAEKRRALSLRYVICAGEALELQSLKPWFERHGDEKPKVVNMYGITETTVHSTYRVIRQADLSSGAGSVIGVPIPDLQVYLVDEQLKPVPAGVAGEICVGGEGVARGYLNRSDLTRQRFLPDPFSGRPGARLYRSGDLAQVNGKGEMEYLGRMDHQVKIRGFRVELGEIESALNGHAAVRESVVVAQEEAGGGKRLVAYVVPTGRAPTVTELRAYLGQKLPEYMLPAVFIFLASLPLTTNGKVDRRTLPCPDGARPELKATFVAPRTATEQALAGMWREVLGLEKVGVQDNFFELGGDSIRSIAILSRAHQRGWRLSLQQIFQHPTVAELAVCAEASGKETALAQTQPFSLVSAEDRAELPADAEDAYPLAKLQLGMFYFNELDPVSAIYHDVFSFRIQGAFEREKLEQALQRLGQRHPILRTSFHLAGYSQPLQVVHRAAQIPLSLEDLRGVTAAEQDQRLVSWVEAEKRRPFERSVAPLVRAHVQLRGEKCFQFIFGFHHACLDGWSLAAVITEIFQDYTALAHGSGQTITPPRVTCRDFVALEQQAISSGESRQFWAEKLQEAGPQSLPRWPNGMRAGGHEQVRGPEVQLDSRVLSGLKALARATGVPLKTVLLAAHQRVMALLYGQTDVITGLVSNGRPEEVDGEKLVGLFLNTLPLRLELRGGTWLELVNQTFAAEREIVPHRRMPLAEIYKFTGSQPLFETAFDFVHFHVYRNLQASKELDLAEGHYFEANNLTTYTTFMLDVTSTRLEMHIDYDPNALCRRQIEEMSAYYVNVLQAMAADPQSRYDRFSPLSPAEQQLLLKEWNATAEDYPREHCLQQLFEARAAERPEALALVCGNEKLTYRELNRRAEKLAGCLRELRVGPEVLVGLCVERSPEMVAALLAILKAGGAYVPLDPTYPSERLAFMLDDAQVGILLTEQKLLGVLPRSGAQIVCLDSPGIAFDGLDRTRVEEGGASGGTAQANGVRHSPPSGGGSARPTAPETPRPDNLAYVIYTSGSTGKPKGVPVAHRALVNLLTSIARTTGFTATDNMLAVTTLSFDIAALELFLPLVTGGTLTLASREQASDGTRLAALLESSGATVMQGTPVTWRLLLEAGWQGSRQFQVFCGGEALKGNLAEALLNRAREVWNFYGPTETTVWSTAWKVAPGQPIAIGRPLANTQLYILDGQLQLVPVGTVGELYISGEGLARGYLKRPELTDKKFIANPFSQEADSRLYKTGDLARYWPNGNIECLGRVDHQVKVRGFRIEPAEVETVLRQHSDIADALVTAREDALGEKRLVGYIISKNQPPSTLELRNFIKTKLPLYMVPVQFVLLKQFPLTPNGKIDMRRLPPPETGPDSPRTCLAPRNACEQLLADVWREVLSLGQVGIDDNFFELGGDSLSATRAFARINKAFGTELTLGEMLDHPTIRSLAELIGQHKETAPAAPPILPRQAQTPVNAAGEEAAHQSS